MGWGRGGGLDPQGTGRTFARSFARSDGRTENSPLCSIGHRPLRVRCPKMMIIMVRDGMGWFTRWGLISHLWVDYGWSVNQKMVVAISNLSYAVSGSLLALIPNFIQIGQKTQKLEILSVSRFWLVGLVGRKMVVGIPNLFILVFV